jgi:hypothetical protein
MSRERLVDAQPQMAGGLNETSDDSALTVNQLRRTTNARLTEFGAVTKRGGLRRTDDSLDLGESVQNGFNWRKDVGTPEILAVVDGTLYTSAFGAFPWTWTAETGTLSTTVPPTFARFRDGANDVVYIGDGGLLNKWDGTTLTTDIVGTIGASMITVHNQRLWSCGCSVAPQSIFYSDLNNGDTLGNGSAGGGQIIVRTFGDENVVALASVNTSLLIFHKRGISRLTGYGQDDIEVAPAGVSSDIGLIAPSSIVTVDNLAYFISERGLYICNEQEVASVSSPETPDPLLAIIRQLSAIQFQNIRAVLNRSRKELWISMPNFGLYVYNTTLRAWSGPWDNGWIEPDTTALFEVLDDEGLPAVLRGDSQGFVSLADAPDIFVDNTDPDGTGGSRYTMSAQFHRLYCGDEATAKALRWGYLTAELRGSDQCRVEWNTGESFGSFTLPPSTDQTWGGDGTQWGTGVWGGSGSKSYRIPMGGNGYYIDVSVVDSGEASPILSRFQIETFALGRR